MCSCLSRDRVSPGSTTGKLGHVGNRNGSLEEDFALFGSTPLPLLHSCVATKDGRLSKVKVENSHLWSREGGYSSISGSVISSCKTFRKLLNLSRVVSLSKADSTTTFKGLSKASPMRCLAQSSALTKHAASGNQ